MSIAKRYQVALCRPKDDEIVPFVYEHFYAIEDRAARIYARRWARPLFSQGIRGATLSLHEGARVIALRPTVRWRNRDPDGDQA
ncbi:hypothetical protein E8L99_12000 [Phreatobacter aquaticus]|uniref:Uncharacterized protein n=1 Tax=Phreatobacter aquaticus TaxID=2570229 RepID=A0A4D7QHQ5_9HYPH|nr:hypothetical protein [Phreatobacter aquaticus]QCK86425.1 hypothetical protein E8L99_12000 [Phreatobacter aquaticus]